MGRIVEPLYKDLCPICKGDVLAKQYIEKGICGSCDEFEEKSLTALSIYRELMEELVDFNNFFRRVTDGLEPWGAQLTWAKRLINGENTVIVAPTGMGKTTLLLVYSLYIAHNYRRKTLFLAPTRALAKQIFNKLREYSSRICGSCINVLFYDSGLSKKKRLGILEEIKNGNYDILVLTNHFLIRHYDVIDPTYIGLIIIDDVDSLMRGSKNIVKLMNLLGFSNELIEKGKRRNSLIWKLMLSRSLNREEDYKRYVEELINIEMEIEDMLRKSGRKQVVIASATGRMKGVYAKVMRDLLRIDVSGVTIYGRNITDSYMLIKNSDLDVEKIVDLVKALGRGAIFYISPRHPLKDEILNILRKVMDRLQGLGYKVAKASPKTIKEFIEGKHDFLIGSSSYYGIGVRGIDAPETIRYVVFFGTPLFSIDIRSFIASPNMLIRTALLLSEITGNNEYKRKANAIRRLIFKLNNSELRLLSMLLKDKLSPTDLSEGSRIVKIFNELKNYYEEIVSDLEKHLAERKVLEMNTITFYHGLSRNYALVPDIMTYIQASGRTSRLYLGRMTHGLSVIIEHELLRNLVNGLSLKMGFLGRNTIFKELSEIDLEREREEIESTRKSLWTGDALSYKNILVVVESPTKAKTIARFFGRPVRRRIGSVNVYEIPFIKGSEVVHLNILATRGHLFDLTTDPEIPNHGVLIEEDRVSPVYTTIKRCRICGHQFTFGDQCPRCGSRSFIDSYEVVNVLRKLAQEADELYIATDPDIEGEKIAYDVYIVVKNFVEKIWRIELHEITINEFLKALENKRNIDFKLVEAEIYRRVMDRVIGFSLSQDLWRKYSKQWLGAGRVQTPVLGRVIESYKEYLANKCRKITYVTDRDFKISLCVDYNDKDEFRKLVEADVIELVNAKTYIETVNPPPPYTTDELLYDASRIGFPASITMKIAQELFESGLITYHRTSYHYVSNTGISIASRYLESKGLKNYFKPSHWGDKGAHEAIRPINPMDREDLEKAIVEGVISPTIPLSWAHYRLYDLIFKRFISSQMKPFKAMVGEYNVIINGKIYSVLKLPIRIIENGFNVINNQKTYPFLETTPLELRVVDVKTRVTSTKPLFNEGSLVKYMRENNLGRPSTYSKIIQSIIRHGYVIRSRKRGYLIPTKTGVEVYSYLAETFPDLVSVDTTRELETRIDMIAEGVLDAAVEIVKVIDKIREYKLPLSIKEYKPSVSASISS